MKIIDKGSVTISLDSMDRQNLARVLNGYYLYKQDNGKDMSPEEISFCKNLESVSVDIMCVLQKNRPFSEEVD